MFPLRDENPTRRRPVMTEILIAINVLCFIPVFWAWITGDEALYEHIILTYGFIPIRFLSLDPNSFFTIFTSMFIHADIFHILGNMLFLHIFGDNVEDLLGRARYIIFYFLCGLAATFLHVISCIFFGWLDVPVIGASGAISGLVGAYVVFFPKARILTAVLGYYGYYVASVRAEVYIGIWFLFQLLWAVLSPFVASPVAYWAHIGGFLMGLFIALLAKPRLMSRPAYSLGGTAWS